MQRGLSKGSLIVSCQPVPGGPMDNAAMVVGFARAAIDAGADALRIESVAYVEAVRAAVSVPIIGIVKRDLDDSPVRITPFVADVEALAQAGADIIAFDATDRTRPASIADLMAAVKAAGKRAMADCSCMDDARAALAAGADLVGTTLSGYVGGPEPVEPDIALIAAMRRLTPHVIAEGRIRTTEQAAAAVRAGAFAVVVGSAITRTEHVTGWYREAVDAAAQKPATGVLAIDIGGSKTLATLVRDNVVVEEITVPTQRETGPDAWLADIAARTRGWAGQYDRAGLAVTGLVDDGRWSALNPKTLALPPDYPLAKRAASVFRVRTLAVNDAQAAAWGEYRFGAGENDDVVFLTISTGIGGGVVLNGKLLTGLAGHFGLTRGPSAGEEPAENAMSGRWIAAAARKAGHDLDTPAVFAASRKDEAWARAIIASAARNIAILCQDIQLMFDPKRIVIGGGVGLAEGFIGHIVEALDVATPRLRPEIVPARLSNRAGAIGVADLASITV